MTRISLIALIATILFVSPAQAATRVFYDGWEAGNTNLWYQDDARPRCTVETASSDGIAGPYAGTYMARCNDPGAAWQTLNLPPFSMTDEVLYRYRVRVDQNHDGTIGSIHKIGRIFHWTGDWNTYDDLFSMVGYIGPDLGLHNDLIMNGERANNDAAYWGDAPGDDTADPATWHTVEYYINESTGVAKVWHDDILVQNWDYPAINGPVGESGEFYLVSNWEAAHDGVNHVYFDNFEVFTDATSGEPATGSMADGSIQAGGTPDTTPPSPPSGLGVQ